MAEPIKIGNVSVMPGEVRRGGIPIGADTYGRERELPLIVYRGIEDGPTLWISGATHGDEPEGPYSIHLTMSHLDPQQMKGTVVLVPVMNVEAFMQGDRGDPRDTFSYDMNRIYPGRADGYASERVAWAHYAATKDNVDLHIAIHSGGDHSFLDTTIFAGRDARLPRVGRRDGSRLGSGQHQRRRPGQSQLGSRRGRQRGDYRGIGRVVPHADHRVPRGRPPAG